MVREPDATMQPSLKMIDIDKNGVVWASSGAMVICSSEGIDAS
jgi:hypothetical protein